MERQILTRDEFSKRFADWSLFDRDETLSVARSLEVEGETVVAVDYGVRGIEFHVSACYGIMLERDALKKMIPIMR